MFLHFLLFIFFLHVSFFSSFYHFSFFPFSIFPFVFFFISCFLFFSFFLFFHLAAPETRGEAENTFPRKITAPWPSPTEESGAESAARMGFRPLAS